MTEDKTLGDKEDKTPSATPTDKEVPGSETEEHVSSEKTVKPETEETEDTTTAKPGGVDEEEQARKSRAQQRIGELIRKNKGLQEELAGGKKKEETPEPESPPLSPTATDTPEIAKAKEFLSKLGFVSNEEVKKSLKEEISNLEAKMVLEDEHNRLTRIYDGEDGRPKYDKDETMKHIIKTGIYNPEAAYKDLHEPELLDWAIKKAKAGGSTFTEKPSSTTTGDTGEISKESLARILSSPEGRKWYEENRDKILSALQKGELS